MSNSERYIAYEAVGFLEKRDGDIYNSYLIAGKSKIYGIVRKRLFLSGEGISRE
ncbi:MAG TPA: hypothetical protein VJ869_06705 [Sphaerochaeta sp.]|nr:hypothetical protein [Sphaerochaeta sp.]